MFDYVTSPGEWDKVRRMKVYNNQYTIYWYVTILIRTSESHHYNNNSNVGNEVRY